VARVHGEQVRTNYESYLIEYLSSLNVLYHCNFLIRWFGFWLNPKDYGMTVEDVQVGTTEFHGESDVLGYHNKGASSFLF